MYNEVYHFIVLLIFALGWGSFSTMAVYRLSHGEPWVGKRPYCTECGHDLSFIDYISILSFFLYRGRCRYCKAKYDYHKVYFVTELLILVFFIVNYLKQGFNEVMILNAGFIIASVIWSIVYFTHQLNLNKMLIVMFFCAAVKRVLLDHTIYNMFYGAFVALIAVLMLRHIYFLLKGEHKSAMDYLEYKPEDRFKSESFIIVKLSVIWGCMMGVSADIIWAIIPILLFMFFCKKLKYSLPVSTNFMVLFFLV